MKVDNYEPQIWDFTASLKSSADAQFNNINYLYIGRNETMREGFVGCISRVEFDEIIPLKLLFQEDPLSNINVSKLTNLIERINSNDDIFLVFIKLRVILYQKFRINAFRR